MKKAKVKFERKLLLIKETIGGLEATQQHEVLGGATQIVTECMQSFHCSNTVLVVCQSRCQPLCNFSYRPPSTPLCQVC